MQAQTIWTRSQIHEGIQVIQNGIVKFKQWKCNFRSVTECIGINKTENKYIWKKINICSANDRTDDYREKWQIHLNRINYEILPNFVVCYKCRYTFAVFIFMFYEKGLVCHNVKKRCQLQGNVNKKKNSNFGSYHFLSKHVPSNANVFHFSLIFITY